jgi:hypothetical protein
LTKKVAEIDKILKDVQKENNKLKEIIEKLKHEQSTG